MIKLLISGYRRFVSPYIQSRCKYHPSCSAYALQAVEVHGAVKGMTLGAWRLLRCNPFSGGGYDPVPDRGAWLPDVYPDGMPRVGARVESSTTAGNHLDGDG